MDIDVFQNISLRVGKFPGLNMSSYFQKDISGVSFWVYHMIPVILYIRKVMYAIYNSVAGCRNKCFVFR